MPIKKYRRQQSENAASDSSVSSRDISPSVSGKEHLILALVSLDYPPIITVPASPNMDQDMTDGTPYFLASPIKQATGDMEQLTYPGQRMAQSSQKINTDP